MGGIWVELEEGWVEFGRDLRKARWNTGGREGRGIIIFFFFFFGGGGGGLEGGWVQCTV